MTTDRHHHKNWTGPWGPFYREKQGTASKWLKAGVLTCVAFIVCAGVVALLWWMFFGVWFDWITPVLYICGFGSGISAACWILSRIFPRLVNMRWRRVFKIGFLYSSIIGFTTLVLTVVAGDLLIRGVIPEWEPTGYPAPCGADCSWWHRLWDDKMWLQSGKYNSE